MSEVLCGGCGSALDEVRDVAADQRGPCPYCGSTARRFGITVHAGMPLEFRAGSIVIRGNPLLMQTVVFGAKTDEGRIVEAVALPWFDIVEMLRKDPSLAYQISPERWEEIVAGAYQRAGFEDVTLTPRSGDHGRDIIAVKRGLGIIRVIDQVKAYRAGHLVKANDVRALMGVLPNDGASKGFLTTTSDFAPTLTEDPLIKPFFPARLQLINGKLLLKRLEELAKRRG